jgi:hypothetical protein
MVFGRYKRQIYTVTFLSERTGDHLFYEFGKYKICDTCRKLRALFLKAGMSQLLSLEVGEQNIGI